MLLLLHSIAHLLVDAVCAAALFGPIAGQSSPVDRFLLYNTLAFSTQCFVGLAADRIGKHRGFASAAMLCVAVSYALPLPAVLRVVGIGLGNSVFHVAAGTETLRRSGGRAAPLGVFVAPGAIGVTVGTLFPAIGPILAGLLAAAAAASLFVRGEPAQDPAQARNRRTAGHEVRGRMLTAALLTAAVAVRAIGGSAVRFPWQVGALPALLTTAFVFAGKTAGGFLCDRIGPNRAAWCSVPLAAILIAFCQTWALPSLLGQLVLNLTMPVTLWLLYCAMPESPGFAFGLAASALWPGTLIGKYIRLTGAAQWVFLLVCFLFCLYAILFSAGRKQGDRHKAADKRKERFS